MGAAAACTAGWLRPSAASGKTPAGCFSPAVPGRISFALRDVRALDQSETHDIALMLYGELNVFSPRDCAGVLSGVWKALAPGGRIVVELQSFDAVKRLGEGPATWSRAASGLFSEAPHLLLTENVWFEEEAATRQRFHVVDAASGRAASYTHVTKAWTVEEVRNLLDEAGFADMAEHDDRSAHNPDLSLLSAVK